MKKFVLALLWLLGGLTPVLVVSVGAIPHEPIPAPYWQRDPVAPGGYANAFAIDAADRPHLVYHDATAGMLRYAVRQPAGWLFSDIAPLPSAHPHVTFDLALEPDGTPCVAYSNAGVSDSLLYYGCLEEGAWQVNMIAAGGRQVQLRIDRAGHPHIALLQESNVVYIGQDDKEVWQSEIVAEPPVYTARLWLAVDSQRKPHVIYHSPLPPLASALSTAGGAGRSDAITDDQPHMVHAVRRSAGEWEKVPLPFSQVEAVAFGPADELWLLVSEWQAQWGHPPFSSARLLLAQPDGDNWITEELREDYDWQLVTDLAVDQSGRAHVIYRDITGLLHYGRRAPDGPWEPHSPGFAEQSEITMRLGGDGQPRLAIVVDGQWTVTTRVVILEQKVFLPGILHQP